ncbi:hypothetical protein IM697_05780 [Streptomyces ferrugineus]|uniref:Metallopeptidase n=1 Tax=Streptomyces ferrugineus TaxID=1413221 RepID=A0A7M2SPJ1_9ACTN|nr:DUF4344 domain-containing metallopeptidase [Streptomyces ferrugineus]QOV37919.1 hypothetical protein IM697_05780 [Streptomyces ferrugineus]
MTAARSSYVRTGAALVGAALTAVSGCSTGSDEATARTGDAVRPVRATASPSVSGSLVVSYEKPKKAADRQAEAFLRRTKALEGVASYADAIIRLPYDVPLRAKSCGEANAFWNPETKDITYCYEFVDALRPIYEKQETEGGAGQRAAAVEQDLIGLTNGVLLHELGHGLIAMYDLPATGEEEDAVDQLSALLLAGGDDEHQQYAIDTINAWGGLAEADAAGGVTDDAYADEHSLDIQRFYNWSCWLYGSDPAAYKEIVRSDGNPDGVLPEERAERCPDEYAKIAHAWGTLLGPYLRT